MTGKPSRVIPIMEWFARSAKRSLLRTELTLWPGPGMAGCPERDANYPSVIAELPRQDLYLIDRHDVNAGAHGTLHRDK